MILIITAGFSGSSEQYWLNLYALALSCLAIALIGTGTQQDIFHPSTVIAVVFFLVFGLGSIRHFDSGFLYASNIVSFAILGVWSFAFANWITSYGARSILSAPKARSVNLSMLLRLYLWGLLFAATIATVFICTKVGVPALSSDGLVSRLAARQEVSSYVVYLARMAQFAAYFFFILALVSRDSSSRIFALIVIAFVLVINLIMGWRGPALFILLTLVFVFHYATAKRHSPLLIAAMSFTLLAVLGWGYLRLIAYSAVSGTGAIPYLQSISSNNIAMFLNWTSLQFSNYAAGFQQVVALKESDPHVFGPMVFGHTLATFLPGQQLSFDQTLKLLSYSNFEGDGLNATLFGEAFADFGTFGIAIYCAGIGALSGLTYKRVCDRPTHFRLIEHGFVMSVLILGTLTGIFGQAIYWFLLLHSWARGCRNCWVPELQPPHFH